MFAIPVSSFTKSAELRWKLRLSCLWKRDWQFKQTLQGPRLPCFSSNIIRDLLGLLRRRLAVFFRCHAIDELMKNSFYFINLERDAVSNWQLFKKNNKKCRSNYGKKLFFTFWEQGARDQWMLNENFPRALS